jgi:hypothetical protein
MITTMWLEVSKADETAIPTPSLEFALNLPTSTFNSNSPDLDANGSRHLSANYKNPSETATSGDQQNTPPLLAGSTVCVSSFVPEIPEPVRPRLGHGYLILLPEDPLVSRHLDNVIFGQKFLHALVLLTFFEG